MRPETRFTWLPRLAAHLLATSLIAVTAPVPSESATAPVAAAGATVPGLATVDSLALAEYSRDSLASITVGVVHGANLVWTRSYGYADMASQRPAERPTIYRIGSITKPFTAVMLLQLVDNGTLRLGDPVRRYLPEVDRVRDARPGTGPLTLVQLATMTGGLEPEPREEGPYWTGPVSRWEGILLSALPHTHYAFAPGSWFQYSNIGYAILGAALARAAHTPYVTWERERILDPLGMHHTRFEADSVIARDLATGYAVDDSGGVDTETPARETREGRGYKVPNGALFTNVDDLARFVSFELGHGPETVLTHARLDTVFSGIVATRGDLSLGYGIGFMARRRGEFTWLGHDGGVAGYSAMMYYDRETQLGVILLRNATGGRVRLSRLASEMLANLESAAAHGP
jgi:CubicO group peptidase (beta-lactamase class C family)